MYFIKSDSISIVVPAKYRVPTHLDHVSISKVSINLDIPFTANVITYTCIYLVLFEAQLIGILYSLRKIFKAIKFGQPFHYTVVNSLIMISAIVSLWYVLGLFHDIILLKLVYNYKPSVLQKFTIEKQASFKWIITGSVIYILSDIFKYGLNLKKETEEFV